MKPERMSSLQLLIAEVNSSDLSKLLRDIDSLVKAIHEHDGTVFHIISTFVVATFDFNSLDNSPGRRADAVAQVLHALGSDVRVLHGEVSGAYENLGSFCRLSFGPVLWNLRDLLTELSAVTWGGAGIIGSP
jgi:hypothetical protein